MKLTVKLIVRIALHILAAYFCVRFFQAGFIVSNVIAGLFAAMIVDVKAGK